MIEILIDGMMNQKYYTKNIIERCYAPATDIPAAILRERIPELKENLWVYFIENCTYFSFRSCADRGFPLVEIFPSVWAFRISTFLNPDDYKGIVSTHPPKNREEAESWLHALYDKVIAPHEAEFETHYEASQIVLPEKLYSDIITDIDKFIHSRKLYEEELGIPWKRGIILYGERGNGKTSLIRHIAHKFGMPKHDITQLVNRDGSLAIAPAISGDWWTEWKEEGGEGRKPSLIYLEDIDRFCQRTSDDFIRVNLRDTLNGIDGIEENSGVLFIATTNNFQDLDKAISDRPGRFDRKYLIPGPNEEMTRIYFERKKVFGLAEEVIIKISNLPNLSYAHLQEFTLQCKKIVESNQIPENVQRTVLSDIEEQMKSSTNKIGLCG